ncbi:MAG: hypothetical protein QOE88_1740, partial [Verrucomicrobiota bacterium]|nr:hypothetical protein [Verrucomicrobiota bacterium]
DVDLVAATAFQIWKNMDSAPQAD